MENMVNPSFWKNKKVLVTGHTGFKGSWLSLWLHDLGAQVYGIALEPDQTPNLFSVLGLENLVHHQVLDIRHPHAVQAAVQRIQPEIIFHMAAQPLVKLSYEHPVETYATNVMGTVHILEAARHCPSVKVIINVTSDKCYQNDEKGLPFVESDPMGGFDPYSNSKGCAELITQSYRHSFYQHTNIALASGRAGNVIGGGDWAKDRLIPDMIRAFAANEPAIIRNPYSTRPWQHVLEPLRGYMMLAERCWQQPKDFAEGWNFAPHEADVLPVRHIADTLVKYWGHDASWQDDSSTHHAEAKLLSLNASKAEAHLQWKPRWNLDTTLKRLTQWYQAFYSNKDMKAFTLHQIQQYQTTQQEEIA